MLTELQIENFKSIELQNFNFRLLTVLTGLNSTGKSSIIQAILLLSKFYTSSKKDIVNTQVAYFSDFSEIRNKYQNAKSLKIAAKSETCFFSLNMDYETSECFLTGQKGLDYEHNLYYISANRIGQEELAIFSKEQKIGRNGEYIFGYFENNKDNLIEESLVRFSASSSTLKAQVNEWLQYILDLPISLQTEKITATNIKVSFSSDGIDNINPFNLGAGNSYLVKILITCLMCRKDDLLLIENPEIHLHPKAQAKLGEFFTWIAEAGIQLIIETHSEHLINKVKYQIYKSELAAEKAIIYYKSSIQENFTQLTVSHSGKFVDIDGNSTTFPSGFFDSTLQELLEIG